jgi:hypothetical protein
MKNLSSALAAAIVLGTLLTAAPAAQAEWYKPSTWFKKKDKRVDLLIVTGNYVNSRLLAELIQLENKQPVLVLPSGEDKIMYALGPNKDAIEIKPENYRSFVKFLRPKQVLFLGDNQYVPQKYIDAVKDDVAIWSITNADWEQTAISAGRMLKMKKLSFDYLVLVNQLEGYKSQQLEDWKNRQDGGK